jgi:hypothetical protein
MRNKYRGGQRWRAQRQRFIIRNDGFFFDALESVALSSALFGEVAEWSKAALC